MQPAVIIDEVLRVPQQAHAFTGFRAWLQSEEFPDRGRIDYLDGDIELEMSPEDLYTHGVVKTAIAARLHTWIVEADRGHVFVDRARVTAPAAGLSAEPDVVVVLWEALDSGRVRQVPGQGGEGRFIELEGGPDLVVEILSDSSETKDRERLPPRYARAGVRELWLVDARGSEVTFEIHRLEGEGYTRVPAQGGWTPSPVLGGALRLRREPHRHQSWRYFFEQRA